MEEEYLVLKRAEEDTVKSIEMYENGMYMFKLILHTIRKRLKQIPAPELPKKK